MTTISFTIHGNHEDQAGNPIPYFRTTQKGQFNKGARRYHGWKDYVRKTYTDMFGDKPKSPCRMTTTEYKKIYEFEKKQSEKPIDLEGKKAYMTLAITFKNKAHADCDNIYKGIADALFINDKTLASRGFDYEYAEKGKGGKVEVLIEIL